MANKMLIDSTHPEETRVVVLRGSRVEEFDFESASKRQLRGNIYLAKVIRVEPSLQAAFVDYGGNRHGFLAFSEIHPDYYQIPVSDRQMLLEDEQREEDEEREDNGGRRSRRHKGERRIASSNAAAGETVSETAAEDDADGETTAGDKIGEDGQDDEASHASDHPLAADHEAARDHETSADETHHASETQEGGETHHAGESHAGSEHHDAGEPHGADHSQADHSETRPVELGAAQTPPYDDPTAELIQHASDLHERSESHDAAVEGSTSEALSSSAGQDDLFAHGAGAENHQREAVGDADEAQRSEASDHAAADGSDDATQTVIPFGDPDGSQSDGPAMVGEDEDADGEEEQVDQLGGDALEEVPRRQQRMRRHYKIQEVIKRRQVLLVQVVKEERGNKGAALTTYLSLAGRYSVLMPNTARGGGISRKITDSGDRQRLKSIAQELDVPEGMGVILRTAGASRSKPEVKRDFEYLMRMWETVRETTLASTAPKLVYEEGSLIKRAIRDLYNSDIDEIVVAGEEGYREASSFMRLLQPSHVRNVQPWRETAPLFTKMGAEAQLDAMFSSHVTLKSGGYLVINQTEALVAIDVNSGRATREHNIEDTALRTNLEAADEIARQLRLRDLAGLIVVDFIDMEESRNNRSVERRIKDALRDDRARIQIGRISHFGLLEMSRQRMRTGVLEGSTETCQHCGGSGTVRSVASIALHVLRVLEDALVSDSSRDMIVRTRGEVALYILNHKRLHLDEIEGRFGVSVSFRMDHDLPGSSYCAVERGEPASGIVRTRAIPPDLAPTVDEIEEPIEDTAEDETAVSSGDDGSDDGKSSGRRRRRRRGRGRDRDATEQAETAPDGSGDQGIEGSGEPAATVEAEGLDATGASAADDAEGREGDGSDEETRSRRRRSRRGGRRRREGGSGEINATGEGTEADQGADALPEQNAAATDHTVETVSDEAPIGVTLPPEKPVVEPTAAGDEPGAGEPDRGGHAPAQSGDDANGDAEAETAADARATDASASTRTKRPEPTSSEVDPSRPKKSGWWQRAKATITG